MDNDEIMTIKEVAAYLKLNEKTTCKLVADGKIPDFKAGGSWRFRREEIVEWTRQQMNASKKQGK